jgi:hypothetical protein
LPLAHTHPNGARIRADPQSLRHSYSASQADAVTFKALSAAPDAAKYPNAARWYKHIASYEDEFPTLPGDASKPYTVYGPEVAAVTLNPAKAPDAAAEEEDEDVDLFGSDEEEDPEADRIREERLAEYRKKKEGKVKPAAKSIVTMDVKPWGMLFFCLHMVSRCRNTESMNTDPISLQTTRPTWLPSRPPSAASRRTVWCGVPRS